MKALRTRTLLLAVAAVGVAMSGPARAGGTCHKINAKGEGVFTGPTSTTSQIIGGGIIHGTTTSDLVITGVEPASGALIYE